MTVRAMQATVVADPPYKPKRAAKKAARNATKSPPASSPPLAAKQEYPQYYHGDGHAQPDFGGHLFNGYHHHHGGGHHGHFPQQQSGYPYYHHHYQVPYSQQQLRYHDADDYRASPWEDRRTEDEGYGQPHYGKPSVDDVGNPTSVNTRNPSFDRSIDGHGILELRKEKSRDAARSRRNKENTEFYELAKMLPLPGAITTQLDKASIIRLTISYLKLRDFSGHGEPPWSRDPPPAKNAKGPMRSRAGMAMDLFEQHQGTHILQSLDGFAFSLGADGRFLYISETVSIYLGLSQVEMTGSSVFDYVHHADHQEVAEQLGLGLAPQGGGQGLASPASAGSEEGIASNTGTMNPDVATQMALSTTTGYKGLERSFCVRMKSTLTKRGCHFKSSGYRVNASHPAESSGYQVVLVLCRLRPQCSFSHSRKATPPLLGMVAIAIALPPPSVHEIRLDSDMFVTRINFDFRIAHCEPRVSELLDYTAEELTGKNLYTLCHGEDANRLRKCHLDLINKGQVLTHYYRLMNKNGGFTWLQTCATVVCSSKNAEETNIICVNYVISAREYSNLILDTCQMEDSIQTVKREDNSNDPENGSPDADRGEGHSSGGPSNPHDTHHRSPPDLDDGSSEAPGDHRGGRHHDHVTQLQPLQPLHRPGLSKKLQQQQRRGSKRKVASMAEDDSSLCTSDEDEDEGPSRTKQPHLLQAVGRGAGVLSPASSSCHSLTADASPKTSAPTPSTPVSAGAAAASANHHPGGEDGADAAPTSVKDLEHAMSKHLPAVSLSKCSSPPLLSLQPHGTTDFSADTLLKQQQQRSTIQWIGAHHHLNHHLNHQQLPHSSAAPLPATALLRQLYANRESVIRANVHAGGPTGPPGLGGRAGSVGPGGGVGGGAPYYTGDVSHVGPLPTPPGSEGSYGDHQFLLHNNKAQGASATADAFNSLVSSYSATGGYSVDYHSAMTPPSSVSPRDKHQHQQLNAAAAAGAFDSAAYSDVLRHQYGGMDGSPAQPLPLKPQAYHSTLDAATAAAYAASTGSLDQSQFYHQGFHLYHPKQAAGPASSWYSAPS